MTLIRPRHHRRHLPACIPVAALLALLALSGCAQLGKLKSRTGKQPTATSTERTRTTPLRTTATSSDPSLAAIVNDQLQHGHYAEGEQALRRYLVQHRGDRSAQAMLSQLTANPEQWLGHTSQPHIVQSGDSYSTLAARYLGDGSLFLILARYNHSTNPSLLRVGETVQVPTAIAGAAPTASEASANTPAISAIAISPTVAEDRPPARESPATKAKRLQRESLVLLDQGHKEQALARLDEALIADPQLQPDGIGALALRKDLLTSLHQRAVVLYRDQRLDAAIALWDRVLALDPHYEPAIVYRTRALELKRRLKQL
ncbi:LysM peptidoglycan-binding domain-containing protein [Rhodanobacter sp. AS-Z3]|uniref:LysM peptidoglycan-binding domain-containing protein n=1 Tax=Rhodanobacter sp. AS-Z3 TaxID=3031330 RepID=UPI0024784733|nr:LysM peptidoglycan-binding domain-containing protein [Rhodanobacter sp. AS-Z3]WEN14712.1 LysM peptidoglycan-binding domain-containing protein [Rhodanobacter sp. AS-Z3]